MLRIKSAEYSDIDSLSVICRNSVLGTKIMCHINAYGLDRGFLSVWCCVGEGEEIFAVICKFEDSLTLVGNIEKKATEDIRTFLDMIGYRSLCCTAETASLFNYSGFTVRKAYIYRGSIFNNHLNELPEESYKDCYMLICRNIPDSFDDTEEAYLLFLSDFTFRKRRGMARIKGYTENGTVVSCVLTSAETSDSAVISGVVCNPSHRKSGLGKRTVLTVAEELKAENKDVYVIALNKSAEGFYEHIGFEFKENISFIERK